MSKPTYTFKDGTKIKYSGKRDVKSVWCFQDTRGVYFGGFSINSKVAASTAKSNFNLYTDGGYKLKPLSIQTMDIN